MYTDRIEIGDRVRAYDFEEDDTCYVEGVVEAIVANEIDCDRYRIRMEKRVWLGREDTKHTEEPTHVYPPVNGTPKSFGGKTNYVIRVRD